MSRGSDVRDRLDDRRDLVDSRCRPAAPAAGRHPISRPISRRRQRGTAWLSATLASWPGGRGDLDHRARRVHSGTNHFTHSGKPADEARAAEYANGPGADIRDTAMKGLAGLEPADADVADVARAIVTVVDTGHGKRPFRVHIDPSQDGAEIVNAMSDRVRAEMFRRIGLEYLLTARVN